MPVERSALHNVIGRVDRQGGSKHGFLLTGWMASAPGVVSQSVLKDAEGGDH